jgi:hypothetical protein
MIKKRRIPDWDYGKRQNCDTYPNSTGTGNDFCLNTGTGSGNNAK